MEIPRLGVELELQLLAYVTVRAMPDPSYVCDPHHDSRQHRILNPVREARDRTHNLMVLSQIRFHCTTMGTPPLKKKNEIHTYVQPNISNYRSPDKAESEKKGDSCVSKPLFAEINDYC